MQIVLASTSKAKCEALVTALAANNIEAAMTSVNAASGMPEQPEGDETLQGARNRASAARVLQPDADLYIAIENGIFDENGSYFDKGVILAVAQSGREIFVYSEAVEFPRDSVEKARQEGFGHTTVGRIMQAQGIVKDHADPHLDLAGKSRVNILQEALSKLFAVLNTEGLFTPTNASRVYFSQSPALGSPDIA